MNRVVFIFLSILLIVFPLTIENFENEINNFVQVCPKEMLDKLENPISNKKLVGQAS